LDMKLNDRESWDEAVEVDARIRTVAAGRGGECYLHRSLVPLNEVDFSNVEGVKGPNAFMNECEGMCGV